MASIGRTDAVTKDSFCLISIEFTFVGLHYRFRRQKSPSVTRRASFAGEVQMNVIFMRDTSFHLSGQQQKDSGKRAVTVWWKR